MPFLPAVLSLLVAHAVAAPADDTDSRTLDLQVGESYVKKEPRPLVRVLVSDPAVAELRLLEEGQFQVRGVAIGTTDLWIWYRDDVDHPRSYKVVVQNDSSEIQRRINSAVHSGTPPKVYAVKDRLVVEGEVEDVETLERVAALAKIFDENFVNLVTVRGDHQVQLHVTFAEVSRTGMRELGLNALAVSPTWRAGLASPNQAQSQFNDLDDPNTTYNRVYPASTTAFNLVAGLVLGNVSIGTYLSVLEQNALARTLARPTLVALSGQQAEFLAGGEVPIPVAQNNGRISIDFKEYGVKVVFVPTVLGGDVIDMRTYVEVSSIDTANATRVSGIEIPSFTTRKGDSHLRLGDGMTFAMAGMLLEESAATRSQIPLLGDIPIVGSLFRYVKHTRQETELVIFVTPELVRPMAAKDVPAAPGTTENYNPDDLSLFLLGSLVQPGSRTAEPTGEIGLKR